MSDAIYCRIMVFDCARRARMASSPEVVTYWRRLGLRWLRLEDQTEGRMPATTEAAALAEQFVKGARPARKYRWLLWAL